MNARPTEESSTISTASVCYGRGQGCWFYGWNIVAIMIILQATTYGLVIYSFSFWIEPFGEEFGIGLSGVMSAAVVINLAKAAYAPYLGNALDRFSSKRLVLAGVVAFGAGMLLVSMATAFWQIVVIYGSLLAVGLVFAGIQGAQTLTAKWFDSRRGLALGISAMGTGLGGFLFPPIVTFLAVRYGWRDTHLIIAISVFVVLLPLVALVIRDRRYTDLAPNPIPKSASIQPKEPPNAHSETGSVAEEVRLAASDILGSRDYWIVAGAFFALNFAFATVQYNIAPIAKDIGIASGPAALLMSSMAGGMIVGKIGFGALSDRIRSRTLFVILFACMTGSVVAILFAKAFFPMVAGVITMGIAAGAALPVAGSFVATRFGQANFGRTMGLVMPAALVAIIGPAFAGWTRSATGGFDLALYAVLAVIIPLAIGVTILDARPSCEQAR